MPPTNSQNDFIKVLLDFGPLKTEQETRELFELSEDDLIVFEMTVSVPKDCDSDFDLKGLLMESQTA